MPTLKQAVELIVSDRAESLRMPAALDVVFAELVSRESLRLAAQLWATPPEEVAVMVLKAAGRKVPKDWLSKDRPTGRFETRERLLGTIWTMWGNKRLVSEIARHVEISTTAVQQILDTAEGRPEFFKPEPHPRVVVRNR